MKLSHICLASIIFSLLLHFSLQTQTINFQSGIQTFIVNGHPQQGRGFPEDGQPFRIPFQGTFEGSPLGLVAPLSLKIEQSIIGHQRSSFLARIRVKQSIFYQNGMRVILESELNFASVKVSYFFISKQVAHSLGLYILNWEHNYNGVLNRQQGESVLIKEKMFDISSQKETFSQERRVLLPYGYFQCRFYMFDSELSLVQKGTNSYHSALEQKDSHIQITFSTSNLKDSFPAQRIPDYFILLHHTQTNNNQKVWINFQETSVTIPKQPYSERLINKQSVFVGLSGFVLGEGEEMNDLDINKIQEYYFVSRSQRSTQEAVLSYTVITLQTEEQTWDDPFTSRLLLTCPLPTYSTSYVNTWTTWTDPKKVSTQSCQMCPTGCYNCSYCQKCLRFVNCTICLAGFNYGRMNYDKYPKNQMVCTCPSGSFPNAITRTCMPSCASVIPNCGSCISYGSGHYSATCATCKSGFFAVANSGSWGGFTECAACIPGCTSCKGTASNCSTCGTGFTKVNGVCVCSTAGTFVNANTGTCTTCVLAIPGCGTCVAGAVTTCSNCLDRFYLVNGKCVACAPNCNLCTASACTNCQATFVITNTTCSCSTSPQMVLNTTSNTCVLCTAYVAGCATCTTTGSPITCVACNVGTYQDNSTTCITCPTLCTTCTSGAVCGNCTNNLVIINSTCGCDANSGNYLKSLTKTCISCNQTFPSCTACSLDNITSVLTCTACDSTSFLSDPTTCTSCPSTCTTCTASNVCAGCITGYQLHLLNPNQCGCINCSFCNSSSLTNCAQCILGTPNVCTLCEPTAFIYNGTCTLCPSQCATCNSMTDCITCKLPFIPSNPVGSCVCNSLTLMYYNPVGPTCSLCTSIGGISSSCTTCQSVGNVTACTACTSGSYVVNGTCDTCPYPCNKCSSYSVCTACSTTFILVNDSCVCDTAHQMFLNTTASPNICVPCTTLTTSLCVSCSVNVLATNSSGVMCSTCQPGTYPDAFYLCSPCPSTCTVCSSGSICSECMDTYSLINNTCTCDKGNQIFQYGQVCLSCHSIINYCQTCANNGTLTSCVACGTGTYLATDHSSCILCPLNCDFCAAGVCTNCTAGYVLNGFGVCDCLTTCAAFDTADPSCIDCALSAVDPITNLSNLLCRACKMATFVVSNQNCNPCPVSCATCRDFVTCLTCMPSFTLIGTACQCNTEANDVEYNNSCYTCGELIPGCSSCSVSGTNVRCTVCNVGWGQYGGYCYYCGIGCPDCTVTSTITNTTVCVGCLIPDFTSDGFGGCTNTHVCDNENRFYYDPMSINVTYCEPCMSNCQICYDAYNCIKCALSFSYLMNKCVCNKGLNQFLDKSVQTCITCQSALSGGIPFLANCKICQQSTVNYATVGIQCQQCKDGFYLDVGTCRPCMNGCQKCSTNATCCSCDTPSWIMSGGACVCNNGSNYFFDGNSSCLPCAIANCTLCNNLTSCIACNIDSFINSSGLCQLSVCGNAVTQGIEECDDGNVTDGDGCSSTCRVQPYYYCVNVPPPSVCLFDSRFSIKMTEIVADCNTLTLKFQIYPYYTYFDAANFDKFMLINTLNSSTKLKGFRKGGDTISYTFSFDRTLQGVTAQYVFDPSGLQIWQTLGYPINSLTFPIIPTNNVLALHYQDNVCQSSSSMKKLATVIEYGSYGVMLLSVFPAKIVGLELTGVIQLAFFSLGSMDNVNVLMSPMMAMKGINGFAMSIGKDPQKKRMLQTQTLTPQRINSIGYNANFLRNCNVMLMLVLVVIVVAFCLYILTYLIQKCAESLHKVAKRLIKEVLLTLILFNCLNFAYSAGIHFRYATPEDGLYLLGTLAAVATLVISVLMAVALSMAEEEGFGEFKDKFKSGCMDRAYFVITIIYRMCLGLYMSTSNEDELSTLIVLGASILFLLYNLVNLPFTKAYHNYRANICHFCQFIVLFIAMYYRSMKSSASSTDVASIYSPVYLEYACIMMSLVVSLVVLIYDIYLWIRECRQGDKEKTGRVAPREKQQSESHEAVQKLNNNSMHSIQSEANEQNNQKPIQIDVYEDSELYN